MISVMLGSARRSRVIAAPAAATPQGPLSSNPGMPKSSHRALALAGFK